MEGILTVVVILNLLSVIAVFQTARNTAMTAEAARRIEKALQNRQN